MMQLVFKRLVALLLLGLLQQAAYACPKVSLSLTQVTPSVWIRAANPKDAAGWTEPVVIWVDSANLWIADPGPHRCAGLALRKELSQRWPGRRQKLINSHSHPRNVLANSAWPKGTPIHALSRVAQQMKLRCPRCLSSLRADLGRSMMKGTRIVLPNRELKAGDVLNMGGAAWRVLEHANAHTESDLALSDEASHTVFSASLLSWGKLPDLARADVRQWLLALNEPEFANPNTVWLGHLDQVAALEDAAQTRRYLQGLWSALSAAYADGRSEHEFHNAKKLLPEELQDPSSLRQHSLNVQRVWRFLEEQELRSPDQ